MSAKKSAKKTSKTQATKAKTKPVAKKAAEPKGAAKPKTDECVKGGKHVWKEDDGDRFCEKCFEPAPKSKSTKASQPKAGKPVAESNQVETPKKAKSAAKKEQKPKKLSAIDAAAKVLLETGEAMNCVSLIEAMATKGYWTSPGGKTPHATLYSAILREVATKGKEARFVKTERGMFIANAKA